MSRRFLLPEQLTEHIQLCIGSNWLVSSFGPDLALVHGLVLKRGVDDLEVEDPTLVRPEDGVSREAGQVAVVACRTGDEASGRQGVWSAGRAITIRNVAYRASGRPSSTARAHPGPRSRMSEWRGRPPAQMSRPASSGRTAVSDCRRLLLKNKVSHQLDFKKYIHLVSHTIYGQYIVSLSHSNASSLAGLVCIQQR
jgi:hypothetical protein